MSKVERSHWVPDASSSVCENTTCGKKFTLFRRRHHCRRCGHLFCSDCLSLRNFQEVGCLTGSCIRQELCCPKCSVCLRPRQAQSEQVLTTNTKAARILSEQLNEKEDDVVGYTIRPKLCSKTKRVPRRDTIASPHTAPSFSTKSSEQLSSSHSLTPPPQLKHPSTVAACCPAADSQEAVVSRGESSSFCTVSSTTVEDLSFSASSPSPPSSASTAVRTPLFLPKVGATAAATRRLSSPTCASTDSGLRDKNPVAPTHQGNEAHPSSTSNILISSIGGGHRRKVSRVQSEALEMKTQRNFF